MNWKRLADWYARIFLNSKGGKKVNWKKDGINFLKRIRQDRHALSLMRDDLNSNITECTKLLYRLEEAERQLNNNSLRLDNLETINREAPRYT